MSIKTVVIDYEPRVKNMAQHLEFVTFSVTPDARAILVFREADTKVQACVNEN